MNIHEYRKEDEMQEIKSNYLVDYETVFKGIPRVKRRMRSNYLFGLYLIFNNGKYYKKVKEYWRYSKNAGCYCKTNDQMNVLLSIIMVLLLSVVSFSFHKSNFFRLTITSRLSHPLPSKEKPLNWTSTWYKFLTSVRNQNSYLFLLT